MKFYIQTIDGEISHDFSFHLIKAINYLKWRDSKDETEYVLSDTLPFLEKEKYIDFCPIGTVEFVCNWYKLLFDIRLKPINIPENLFKFASRKIVNMKKDGYIELPKDLGEYVFVKSNDTIKYSENGEFRLEQLSDGNSLEYGNYQVSELIDIESEYRIFVFKNEILDVRLYSGSWEIFPDVNKIKEIVDFYKNDSPIAYTLDIGINENGTFIIEIHDFYSCGLYGFTRINRLPYMFWSSHLEKIRKYNG